MFGFILSRSGAADYDFIQGMFLFTELQLYGIIAVAVLHSARHLVDQAAWSTIFGLGVSID